MTRKGKTTDIEKRLVFCPEREGEGELDVMGGEDNTNILELGNDDGCTK